ncbi:MAG: hypothetical protein MUE44_20470 [Oscillatoriaceae cyanobacterium Prado104]|nr:hypothetical protein [Oscillatoriaceae cyanobacterium Prado104]
MPAIANGYFYCANARMWKCCPIDRSWCILTPSTAPIAVGESKVPAKFRSGALTVQLGFFIWF